MKFKTSKSGRLALAIASGFALAGGVYGPGLQAADHRDSSAVDAIPEGDLTDVFAFVDPNNNNNVILAFVVNPFLNPNESPSARFGGDLLYQIKIDNSQANGAAEDEVIQVTFSGDPARSAQAYSAVIGTPSVIGGSNNVAIQGTPLCSGSVFVNSAVPAANLSREGVIVKEANGVTCFAGVEADSFQTDVAQAVFRVGLNPSQTENAINHDQDMFRGEAGTGSLLGGLRGRPLHLDGSSGVDGFGGYDTTAFEISVPKSLLRGSGVPNVAKGGAVDPSLVGIWATVSRPTSDTFDGWNSESPTPTTFDQFERMGQELTNTVFIFKTTPNGSALPSLTVGEANAAGGHIPGTPSTVLTTAQIKDFYNTVGPEHDVALFSRYFPDTLTTTATPGSPATGGLLGALLGGLSGELLGANTINGRAALLTVLGFNSVGITGTPLLLPQVGLTGNTNKRLLSQLTFPDYLRLNLDVATDGVRPGAAVAGNSSSTFAIGQWGLQNGRRPADDVTDIILRLNRELDDVQFPSTLVLQGIADAVPGSGPLGSRSALSCTQLNLVGGLLSGGTLGAVLGNLTDPTALLNALIKPGSSDGLTGKISLNVLTPCEDPRIFLVLQGTDWIKTNPLDVLSVANQNAPDHPLDTAFPYFGVHPVPGETGTTDFPVQN